MFYPSPLRDQRRLELAGTPTLVCEAAINGHDKNGIPLTPRAQWLDSLFRSGALRLNSDYLYRWTRDPNTKRWHPPDAPTVHTIMGRRERRMANDA